jgi:transglutaminase-like putative cysteine protease
VRFQATHKLVTYLLVLAAFGTVASTGSVSGWMALVFLFLVGVSWRIEAGSPKAALFDRRLTLTRVFIGAVLVHRTWLLARQLPEPDLVPVVDFVLVALAVKLCYRRNNRDDFHVLVLSFLLVIAAAALGGSFLFALAFVAYVVLATWALVLFHLRREMEENYLVKHSSQSVSQKVGVARILNSRRVVGAPFFGATGLVALGVAGGAIATFTLVPRVGAGFVFGVARPASNLVGFSDDVSLGHHGTLSTDNKTVALRATVPRVEALPSTAARERAVDGLYWRGTVYDTYDGGHWTRARRPELRTTIRAEGGLIVVNDAPAGPGGPPGVALDRQEIDVVGLTVPVAFALDRPFAFELPASRGAAAGDLQLAPRWSGEVALRLAPPNAPPLSDGSEETRVELRTPPNVHYVAYSVVLAGAQVPPRAGQAPPLSPEARASYLQLPPSLGPRVIGLARDLTGGTPSPAVAVHAVTEWLRATHQYTLQLPVPARGMDPVESFLFETRAGHCEYFATAAALLLRASGVPTRYVNGYLGGEWNDIGRYVAVRDSRAHSWIEAYLPGTGWTRVDATPPLPTTVRAGRMRQLFDSLDYKWARAILGYDLSSQLGLARRLAQRLGLRAPEAPGGGHVPAWAVVFAAVAAVAAAGARLWPSRKPKRPAPRRAPASALPVQHLYDRVLARLADAGLPRQRAETPREYAARVAAAGRDEAGALGELTELYAAARFGRREVDKAVLGRLARRLVHVGRAAPRAAA